MMNISHVADKEAAKIEQWKRQVIPEPVNQSTLVKPRLTLSVFALAFVTMRTVLN